MRFLSVAERELRAAARRPAMYRIRWITAAAFFILLLWLAWTMDAFQNRSAGSGLFESFSIFIFLYCLFVGATGTADCISRERREGTLGFLFLSNLNSAEIVAGKLCSNALAAFYSLVAICPLLALPLLLGGITFGHFWPAVLALANALFFAVAAGFVASAVSVRQFPAIALATGLSLFFGMGMLGISGVLRKFGCPNFVADTIADFCPLHALLEAENKVRLPGQPRQFQYWLSLAAVAGMSWTWLALVVWRVGRTWRDRPKRVCVWSRFGFGQRFRKRGSAARAALRQRLLKINPYFWLAGRQQISAPIFMLVTVVIVLITVTVTAPYFARVFPAGAISPMVGQMFAWLWTGLAIHALMLYYGGTVAAQRLAEDKQIGALELILSTPTSERTIARGLWLAYGRRMLFPALVAVLVHLFFIWQCASVFILEPFERHPSNITAGRLIWSALLDQPVKGFHFDWHLGVIFRILLLALVVLMANWLTLGWVGRWLGLRMKHPGFAPMGTVILAVAPPVILFSLVCYLCSELHLDRLPDRRWLPIMIWVGFGIGMGNCLLLSVWAAGRLRRDFRATVASRYDSPSLGRWWRPSRRTFLRFTAGATAVALMAVAMVLLFYGYQNWRSQRRWDAFQKELKQRSESLELSVLMPGPVPAAQNFAQSQAFQNLLNRKPANAPAAALLQKSFQHSQVEAVVGSFNNALTPWIQQGFADFDTQLKWIVPKTSSNAGKDRKQFALAVWDGLKPLEEDLLAVAAAAQLPFFQLTTNRNADAVYQSNLRELSAMEQLHFLFQLRACVRLALDRPEEAGQDVLTSLRLAQLARQSPDIKSSMRVNILLARSMQPLWEGLVDHAWSESQLAVFKNELAQFDLLSDHTNAIRRFVLGHVGTWRTIADKKTLTFSDPRSGGGPFSQGLWEWQPRAWRYDNCIQLYRAGQEAIASVDGAAGRVGVNYQSSDLTGLPLDGASSQLLQQNWWWPADATRVSFAQNAVHQAVIACALERFRLAHGTYPETLNPLMPDFLRRIPNDTIRGRPMFYQRNDRGGYDLRGAGPNGTIDQGKTTSDDWLWSFPAATNSTPATAIKGK